MCYSTVLLQLFAGGWCFLAVLQKVEELLQESHVTEVVQLLHEVVSMVTEDSQGAVGYCVSFLSPPSSTAIQRTRLTEGIEHEKVSVCSMLVWLEARHLS